MYWSRNAGDTRRAAGDIVKAFDLDVLRKDVLCLHVHAHQRFHRGGILGSIQALDRHIACLRTFGTRVEGVLHPGDERIDILLRGLRISRRRHQTSAQFAQRLFPDLRVLRRSLEVQTVQREPAALHARVVARGAVSR